MLLEVVFVEIASKIVVLRECFCCWLGSPFCRITYTGMRKTNLCSEFFFLLNFTYEMYKNKLEDAVYQKLYEFVRPVCILWELLVHIQSLKVTRLVFFSLCFFFPCVFSYLQSFSSYFPKGFCWSSTLCHYLLDVHKCSVILIKCGY